MSLIVIANYFLLLYLSINLFILSVCIIIQYYNNTIPIPHTLPPTHTTHLTAIAIQHIPYSLKYIGQFIRKKLA